MNEQTNKQENRFTLNKIFTDIQLIHFVSD